MPRHFYLTAVQSIILAVLLAGFDTSAHPQCLSNSGGELRRDGLHLWRGIAEAPRNAVRARNLKWELPIAAAAGVLIATGDTPGSRALQSRWIQTQAGRWSNIGLGMELGGAGAGYVLGCAKHSDGIRQIAQLSLEAAAAATVLDQAVKHATNRQRPGQDNASGEFWEGGRSFASGHAAASFAIAGVIARRHPHGWMRWGVFGLATAVSLARYPAKQHFFSDILIGGTLGYVTGAYLGTSDTTTRPSPAGR